jgi:hypothetical protein
VIGLRGPERRRVLLRFGEAQVHVPRTA